MACAIFAILAETWLVAGWIRPVRVAGGSMAPALLGPHRRWTCAACGVPFACGLESLPAADRAAICPYCQAENEPGQAVDTPGQRVLVDRSAFAWRRPRRWEVVVLRCPEISSELCVKRVVGLPGERVEIRGGDIWIDGRTVRKSLREMRSAAVLVHASGSDASRPPGRGAASTVSKRWLDPSGAWQRDQNDFVLRADDSADFAATSGHNPPAANWLTYHHPERPPSLGPAPGEARDGPILDESPYDQAESRRLNPVADVLLRARISCAGRGQILLRGAHRGHVFMACLDVGSGAVTLTRGDSVVASASGGQQPNSAPFELEWMLADGRVCLAIDGRPLLDYLFQSAGSASAGPPDLAIGACRAAVTITRLEICRDVYYTPATPTGESAEYQLGAEEYYLLGDNSPHSLDSRSWRPAGASAQNIVGRAVWW